MGHISSYRRMLVWGIGTVMAIAGAAKISLLLFAPAAFTQGESPTNMLLYIFLFFGGVVAIVVNETVFSVRKTGLEIDRDEIIKGVGERHPHTPMVLAICPQCKKRVPSDSKYCLECGADLQLQTPTPSVP
ncbi:MAG TPA: zinc ribbon domain-containing protein [Candidatus Bathyarchaeia archaeon]|nr:zinc ribbon domain-containing protein [Candidatus Bathyarchaeia archaeon]